MEQDVSTTVVITGSWRVDEMFTARNARIACIKKTTLLHVHVVVAGEM